LISLFIHFVVSDYNPVYALISADLTSVLRLPGGDVMCMPENEPSSAILESPVCNSFPVPPIRFSGNSSPRILRLAETQTSGGENTQAVFPRKE
jgi:hypothetical protein